MTLTKRHKIDIVLLAFVVIGGWFAVMNATAVADWFYFLRYKPSPAIVKLADDAGLSEEGKKLLYRFNPQLVDEAMLSAVCGSSQVQLGCTQGKQIYILKATNAEQYNRDVVTAAHEMLHVAYSRLSLEEQDTIGDQLNQQIQAGIDRRTRNELRTYDTQDFINEAHSFIPTQEPRLIESLEQYYKRYFTDRQKTINAYQNSPEGG